MEDEEDFWFPPSNWSQWAQATALYLYSSVHSHEKFKVSQQSLLENAIQRRGTQFIAISTAFRETRPSEKNSEQNSLIFSVRLSTWLCLSGRLCRSLPLHKAQGPPLNGTLQIMHKARTTQADFDKIDSLVCQDRSNVQCF